jgi:hypothetical protein
MLLIIPLFSSHLHSLFLLLIISHYLHVPLYFCLSVIYIPCLLVIVYMFLFNLLFIIIYSPYLFPCLSVIIDTFLFNLLFIGNYQHVPCAKVKNPRCYQEPVFATKANVRYHCQDPTGFPNQTLCGSQEKNSALCECTCT